MIDLPLLHEYESIDVRLTDAAARSIAETGFVNVTPAPDVGRWRITAKEYVGSLVVDDMRLLVRPKIKPDNLFLLLEVGLPPSAWRSGFSLARRACPCTGVRRGIAGVTLLNGLPPCTPIA